MPLRTCPCGSGERPRPQYDGYGIFLTYTCSRCEAAKMVRFRPDIRTRYETDEQIEAD